MRNTWRAITPLIALLIGCLLFNTQSASAQSSAVRDPERRPPEVPGAPEPGLRFITSEMSFSGRVVKRAPFSAEILTESTQTLGNGAKLTRRTTGMIFRDSEGRTRREMSAIIAGPFATSGDAQRVIFISDPVAGFSSTIIPGNDAAQTKTLPIVNDDPPPDTEFSSENSRTESLGKQIIEGVEAEGSRTTILIPAGRVGNDRPLEIVHERWRSPELQTILLSRHSDPRWGETVYKLRNINRSAPDSSLFNLPPPSKINDAKKRPKR
ncbi:MAG TPA: hypothetical protein VJ810_36835 [Blastocatellia bacterium]|nr:hypothetical protein [Blastocatellia bacterium]